jgi:chromosome segregation ATPase
MSSESHESHEDEESREGLAALPAKTPRSKALADLFAERAQQGAQPPVQVVAEKTRSLKKDSKSLFELKQAMSPRFQSDTATPQDSHRFQSDTIVDIDNIDEKVNHMDLTLVTLVQAYEGMQVSLEEMRKEKQADRTASLQRSVETLENRLDSVQAQVRANICKLVSLQGDLGTVQPIQKPTGVAESTSAYESLAELMASLQRSVEMLENRFDSVQSQVREVQGRDPLLEELQTKSNKAKERFAILDAVQSRLVNSERSILKKIQGLETQGSEIKTSVSACDEHIANLTEQTQKIRANVDQVVSQVDSLHEGTTFGFDRIAAVENELETVRQSNREMNSACRLKVEELLEQTVVMRTDSESIVTRYNEMEATWRSKFEDMQVNSLFLVATSEDFRKRLDDLDAASKLQVEEVQANFRSVLDDKLALNNEDLGKQFSLQVNGVSAKLVESIGQVSESVEDLWRISESVERIDNIFASVEDLQQTCVGIGTQMAEFRERQEKYDALQNMAAMALELQGSMKLTIKGINASAEAMGRQFAEVQGALSGMQARTDSLENNYSAVETIQSEVSSVKLQMEEQHRATDAASNAVQELQQIASQIHSQIASQEELSAWQDKVGYMKNRLNVIEKAAQNLDAGFVVARADIDKQAQQIDQMGNDLVKAREVQNQSLEAVAEGIKDYIKNLIAAPTAPSIPGTPNIAMHRDIAAISAQSIPASQHKAPESVSSEGSSQHKCTTSNGGSGLQRQFSCPAGSFGNGIAVKVQTVGGGSARVSQPKIVPVIVPSERITRAPALAAYSPGAARRIVLEKVDPN